MKTQTDNASRRGGTKPGRGTAPGQGTDAGQYRALNPPSNHTQRTNRDLYRSMPFSHPVGNRPLRLAEGPESGARDTGAGETELCSAGVVSRERGHERLSPLGWMQRSNLCEGCGCSGIDGRRERRLLISLDDHGLRPTGWKRMSKTETRGCGQRASQIDWLHVSQ